MNEEDPKPLPKSTRRSAAARRVRTTAAVTATAIVVAVGSAPAQASTSSVRRPGASRALVVAGSVVGLSPAALAGRLAGGMTIGELGARRGIGRSTIVAAFAASGLDVRLVDRTTGEDLLGSHGVYST